MATEVMRGWAASVNLTAGEARSPWSSTQWREYFRRNAQSLLHIPWDAGVSLTVDERAIIAASVQEFQLGESSDGHHFLHAARQYALASGDVQYVAALRRLIAEEQRHGRDLGQVLDLAGIERIRQAWADTVFRWLRRQAGLELSISILVTAEIIAQVYYIALRDATGSLVLRRLCEQILRDEDAHVRFQCERLALLRQRDGRCRLALKRLAQRSFFLGTCLVFWLKHAPVMRAGGFGFLSFLRAGRRQMNVAARIMHPRQYRFAQHGKDVAPVADAKPAPATPRPAETSLDLGGNWLEL